MHSRKFLVDGLFILSFCLITSVAGAQNEFKIPDIQPSKMAPISFRSDASAQESTFSPITRTIPPVRPITENELRGGNPNNFSANPQSGLSQRPGSPSTSQPVPPRPQIDDNRVVQPQLAPLQQLDPARISPELNRSNAAQLAPQINPDSALSIRQSLVPTRNNNAPYTGQRERNSADLRSPRIPTTQEHQPSTVVPAGFNNPAEFNSPLNNDRQPVNVQTIVDRYDVSEITQPLPGIPTALVDMLKTTPVRNRRAMVAQYWETYFDWATLLNRRSHQQWIGGLANPRTRTEQMLLQTARSLSADRVLAAEIQLAKSQSKLRQLARTAGGDLLPLPMNQPLVTKYNSHYDWYASRNLIPAQLQGINEMLPKTFSLMAQRAGTVGQAEQGRDAAKGAFAAGQVSVTDLLESGRLWQSSLQSFVGTVISYNQAIADYALTITPPKKPLNEVVAMLVAAPKSVSKTAARNSVLQRPRTARRSNVGNNRAPNRSNILSPGIAGPSSVTPTAPSFNRPNVDYNARRLGDRGSSQAITSPLRSPSSGINPTSQTGQPSGSTPFGTGGSFSPRR